MPKIDLSGQSYNSLTIIRYSHSSASGRHWVCQCVCGSVLIKTFSDLKLGKAKACQTCVKASKKHFSHTREYKAWSRMITRCCNETYSDYHNYGGRGIKVCEKWRFSFKNFLSDMGLQPSGMQLDRIDNNGNYEPSNCRWVNRQTNNRNRRTNVLLTYNGETLTRIEWAEKLGISAETIRGMQRRGHSDKQIFGGLINKKEVRL